MIWKLFTNGSALLALRSPEKNPGVNLTSLMLWSIGPTNSRCGPVDALKLIDRGIPPFLRMYMYSPFRSSLSVGVRLSEAFTGSHCCRTGSRNGEVRQAMESGRGIGRVVNPGVSSTPGDRAVVE